MTACEVSAGTCSNDQFYLQKKSRTALPSWPYVGHHTNALEGAQENMARQG